MLELSWLLPLAILFQEMSALKKGKKREKKEEIRGNKKGQVPGTSEKKVRREVKMDKCPTVELGVQDTHPREKKRKKNIEHLILLKKFQKSKKGMYPIKRAQVELDFHHCYHHHHHTPFICHTCTS